MTYIVRQFIIQLRDGRLSGESGASEGDFKSLWRIELHFHNCRTVGIQKRKVMNSSILTTTLNPRRLFLEIDFDQLHLKKDH